MDSPYGAGMDPTPYIAAAYGLATLIILGYILWNLVERRRLRQQLAAVKR